MQVSDYDNVMALWQQTEHMLIREADSRENITLYLDKNPNMSFVAQQHGKIIGAVLAGTDGRRGYLQHLAVDAEHRGQRIGKSLVERVTQSFAQIGISKTHLFVNTDNEQAQQFYQSMGWEVRKEVKMYSFNASANLDI
ncbi:GNAT family N-acetyltransferase [Vibrio hangzhouensis]|uniref:GNAT family N-acetyltransferase n=1 Tax=Vibrio hangzhouensis TaxID=462991 RepID=UPI001C94FB65|nr:GNAT family N-acetyltransferase [Vibrio hangzhouensis]MBY6196647.1 GNAT family N-acetyltransferase [Vibrio hangzhouensis]